MKTFIYIIALVLTFIATLGSAVAQDLPINSTDQIRQYAMKQARFGSRYVWSLSIDWSNTNNVTSIESYGVYGEQILDTIFGKKMQYALINTNDSIKGYSYLYDEDWNILFYGYADYGLGENLAHDLWLQYVPITVPGGKVIQAEILVLDYNGQTVTKIGLEIRNGKPMFPWWYAGAPNGILFITFEGGGSVKYNLWNPEAEQSTEFVEVSNYKVDGHYVYRFTGKGDKEPSVKIMEINNRPSVFIENAVKQYTIIDVVGIYFENGQLMQERPSAMLLENQEDGSTKKIGLMMVGSGQVGPAKVSVPDGTYRATFEWNKYGQPQNIYYSPGGEGGGKGKVAVGK